MNTKARSKESARVVSGLIPRHNESGNPKTKLMLEIDKISKAPLGDVAEGGKN